MNAEERARRATVIALMANAESADRIGQKLVAEALYQAAYKTLTDDGLWGALWLTAADPTDEAIEVLLDAGKSWKQKKEHRVN
jgi:hypothetical protein